MSRKPKILAFAGSMRKDSFNKKLVPVAVEGAEEGGADVTVLDLADFRMPPYDGDEEAENGLPEKGRELKKLMIEHDGFIIVSPEYNSSIPGTLKNVIDWVSRPEESDPYYLVAFRGKAVALLSASPGDLGGLRGLFHTREIFQNVYAHVLPKLVTLPKANEAFDEAGKLKNEKKRKSIVQQGKDLAEFLTKLKSE